MIRHIVMWTVKATPDADKATNILKLKNAVESCHDCVPGILEFEVGVASEGLEASHDVVLNSLFVDQAALQAYQDHPEHQKVKPIGKEVTAARSCVDYIVNPSN